MISHGESKKVVGSLDPKPRSGVCAPIETASFPISLRSSLPTAASERTCFDHVGTRCATPCGVYGSLPHLGPKRGCRLFEPSRVYAFDLDPVRVEVAPSLPGHQGCCRVRADYHEMHGHLLRVSAACHSSPANIAAANNRWRRPRRERPVTASTGCEAVPVRAKRYPRGRHARWPRPAPAR